MHALIVSEAEEEALCGSDYGFEQLLLLQPEFEHTWTLEQYGFEQLLLLLLLQLEFKSLGHDIHSFVCQWSPQQNFLRVFGQHLISYHINVQEIRGLIN